MSRFIDWDGNGKIDPTDIGIGVTYDNDEEKPKEPMKSGGSGSGCGCLSTLGILGVISTIALVVWLN
jgi:hypothetical protein